jgi:hypothetical protein
MGLSYLHEREDYSGDKCLSIKSTPGGQNICADAEKGGDYPQNYHETPLMGNLRAAIHKKKNISFHIHKISNQI